MSDSQPGWAVVRVRMGENGSLSSKQLKGLGALLTEKNVRAAALASGISETTFFRWLAEPLFRHAFAEAQSKVFDSALGNLQAGTAAAVEALLEVLQSGKPSERVSAARSILEFSLRARELIELETRLRALETMLEGR